MSDEVKQVTTNTNSLAVKISAAALEVGGKLKADKRNKDQGYEYISADKILTIGGQALAGQGVAIIPQVVSSETVLNDTANNKKRWDARLNMLMLVTDGTSEIVVPWVGFGSDYAVPDKAAYKAMTGGHKYFVMKLLSIGEGNEDGEHETEEQPARTNGKAQKPAPAQPPATQPAPKMTREAAHDLATAKGTRLGDMTDEQLSEFVAFIDGLIKKGEQINEVNSKAYNGAKQLLAAAANA